MSIVDLTRSARRDLVDIGDYIARDSPERAARFLEGLADSLDLLADMPLRGRSRAEIRPGLRSIVHGEYLVFYRPLRDGISVIRVVHGHRDLANVFR